MHFISLHSRRVYEMESGMLACTALGPESRSVGLVSLEPLSRNKVGCDM
jgi:hypothetical protein